MPVWLADDLEAYVSKGYESNADLFSITNFIGTKAASVKWKLYKVELEGKTEITDHEILDLWKCPNNLQGGYEFRKQAIEFFAVTGNLYINGVSPKSGLNEGKISELWVMPSQIVQIVFGTWREPIKGYKILFDETGLSLEEDEVLHMKASNLNSEMGANLYGMSKVKPARMVVTSSNDAQTTKAALLQNQGAKGFISGDGKTFTQEQATRVQEKLKLKSGPYNAGKITAVAGSAKWIAVGMSATDLGVNEGLLVDLRRLCNTYGLSAGLFNDPEGSTYNNKNEERKAAYTDCIVPLLEHWKDELHRFWISTYDENLVFEPDFSDVPELQQDMAQMATTLSVAWWITPNEKNRIMGKPEINDPLMDVPWIPTGITPLTDVDNIDDELKKLGLQEYTKNGIDIERRTVL